MKDESNASLLSGDIASSLTKRNLNITYNVFDKPKEITWTNVNGDNLTMKLTYDGSGGLLRKERLKNDQGIDTLDYKEYIQWDYGRLDMISL